MEETTLKVLIFAVKHFDGHQYTNMICLKQDDDEKEYSLKDTFFVQTQKAERAIKFGSKIICDGVEFSKNKEKITRSNVKGDCGVKYKIVLKNYRIVNDDEDTTQIEKLFDNPPKPVIPRTLIDSKLFKGVFLVEEATFEPTSKANKALKGKITNGKDFKFQVWVPNLPLTQRDATHTEMILIRGVFRMLNVDSGFQVQGWGEIIYADKHTVYPDAYIERKRLEFLKGNTLECISKDLVQCTSVEEMVRKVHGSKVKKHSPPMRMYVKGLEWNRIVKEPKNGDEEPWYNGTLYGCSNPELSGVRLKVKDKVMREVIMLKPASQARNYKSDLALMMDVTDRIEDKFWNVELMYAFVANKAEESNKKVGQPPAKKKRKKNNSAAPQCVTGYISVISMKPC
eukprot:469950_1